MIKSLAFGGQVQWQDLKLFEREAQILRELNHSCIPKYYYYFMVFKTKVKTNQLCKGEWLFALTLKLLS